MSHLQVKKLSVNIGGLMALDDVSFDVKENQVFSIVGPNGAGKSTIFYIIRSFYKPSQGQIFFDAQDITSTRPDEKPS